MNQIQAVLFRAVNIKVIMKQSHSLQNCLVIWTILLCLNSPATWSADDAVGPIAPGVPKAGPARHERAQALKPASCSADGELYACATDGGRIKLSRTTDGVAQRTFYLCRPESLALSNDGRYLAAVGKSDGCLSELKVWNARDGALVWKLDTEFGAESLLFSKDASFLAVITAGSTIELWNLQSGKAEWSEAVPAKIFFLIFNSQELVAVLEDGRARRFPLH